MLSQEGSQEVQNKTLFYKGLPHSYQHHKIWILSSYVPSLDNLADLPSRGLPVPGYSRASSSFTLPLPLQPYLARP